MTDITGIHYETSTPVQNHADGYWYQRVRQVDDKGNVVGSGDRMIRSARPDSKDGLFDPNGSVTAGFRTAYGTARVTQILAGILLRKPALVFDGARKIGETFSKEPPEFLKRGYKDWPGTDEPWEGAPSGNNGLTKPNDGLGKQGMGLPGFDPRSGISSDVRDEALAQKMNPTANDPFDPLNAVAEKADNAQLDRASSTQRRVTTGTQLFQGPNGRPLTEMTAWQSEADVSPFESAHKAVPFASYPSTPYSAARLSGQNFEDQARLLRLMPTQEQGDIDSPAVMRSLAGRGAGASVAPAPSDDMNELLKLRSMIQAVGSRGLFPIQ